MVAAPTGVAAINAGGVTLHSLFQMPFHPFLPTRQNKEEWESQARFRERLAGETPACLLGVEDKKHWEIFI